MEVGDFRLGDGGSGQVKSEKLTCVCLFGGWHNVKRIFSIHEDISHAGK